MADEGTESTTDAGASAEAPGAAAGADAEALSAAAAAAPEAPAKPQPASKDTEPGEDSDLDTDPPEDLYADPEKARKYVEKLRKEAAAARVKAKEARAPFEGWSPDDAKVLGEVIQLAAADPKVGAAKMREIADLLDKGDVEGAAEAAADASEAAAAHLTPEDIDAKVREAVDAKDREHQLNVKRDEIIAKTKELGYEPGSADYFTVLHVAQFETNGDLEAAHAKIEERNQAIIDKFLDTKREEAAGTPRYARRSEHAVAEMTEPPKDMKDARNRARSRFTASNK